MEGCRNEVSNSHATPFQIISEFPSETDQERTSGAMGALYVASSATVFAPLGPWGKGFRTDQFLGGIPGAGTNPCCSSPTYYIRVREPQGLARGPAPPPCWGGMHSREASGSIAYISPSLGNPPQMAPPNLGSIAGHSLPIFPRYVLPDGPPDARGPLEVLVGIVLGELDSSTPRVSGCIETLPDKKMRVGSLHNP